jgi:hypothetical protein
MIKQIRSIALCAGICLGTSAWAETPLKEVPEPFSGFDPSSTYTIKYNDVDAFLSAAVMSTGRSTREKAEAQLPKTGTRMAAKVQRATVNEANRFLFEAFEGDDNQHNRQALQNLRANLERVPDLAPLSLFSRDEQLAYWLNLYNVTLLDEIVAIYPQRNMKKYLIGRKSLLEPKVLTVAGLPLSLNDIQYTILRQNYDGNPLVLYGLYQGIIGGPNIRKHAYTGEHVWRQLEDNAEEFVNSNRGTDIYKEDIFKASSFYERNAMYFDDFQADLRSHLLTYLQRPEYDALERAREIDADINDWSITDLYGSFENIGGSFADNNAAMLDAVQNVSPDQFGGGVFSSNMSVAGSSYYARQPELSRFSPQLTEYLVEVRARQEATARSKLGTVTVEELGQAPGSEQPQQPATQDEDAENQDQNP